MTIKNLKSNILSIQSNSMKNHKNSKKYLNHAIHKTFLTFLHLLFPLRHLRVLQSTPRISKDNSISHFSPKKQGQKNTNLFSLKRNKTLKPTKSSSRNTSKGKPHLTHSCRFQRSSRIRYSKLSGL